MDDLQGVNLVTEAVAAICDAKLKTSDIQAAVQMENRGDQVAIRLCAKRMCFLSKNEKLDRISWLPEHIIHEILDSLPLKDAARTSILSKTWKGFTNSYPILHFDHNLFGLKCLLAAGRHKPNIREIREEFMNFVKYHLFKVMHQKLPLRKLALNVAIDDSKCFSRVDHLMDMVCKLNKVEELCLFVQTNDSGWDILDEDNVCYNIPFSVLASKGLRSLYVRGCKFSSLANNVPVAFSSLRKLSLSYAAIDEDFVINLTHCCSGIEILEFDKCTFWFEFLELSVFPRLKKASFLKNYDWLSDTIIDHTGLESFKCDAHTTCEFTAAAYGSIRELTLSSECSLSPSSLFENLTNTFPLLEEAELSIKLDSIDRFEASNHHLRKLSFSIPENVQLKEIYIDRPNLEWLKLDCCGLKKVYINCPSLRQLLYIGDAMPAFPLFNSSAALKVIRFQVGVFAYFNSLWFMRLRGLIKQMAQVGRVIHLNLSCCPAMVSKQSDVHLTFGIAVRNLNFKNPSGLIDGLIWSTCPTTLTFAGTCYELVKGIDSIYLTT